jgi:hypothetical protein
MFGRWRGPALAGLAAVAAVLLVGSTNPARAQCYGYNAYGPGYVNRPAYGYGYGYGYNVAPRYSPVIPRVYAYNYGYSAGYRRPYYGGGYYGHRGGYYHGGYHHGRFRR